MGVVPPSRSPREDQQARLKDSSAIKERSLYRLVKPAAENIKALINMVIGYLVAVVVIGVTVSNFLLQGPAYLIANDDASGGLHSLQSLIFAIVATGLGVAAAMELAYTLYTKEPDEALNPVMLAVAAAIILQVARLHDDNLGWARITVFALSILALAGLFAIRKWLAGFGDDNG